MGSPLFKPLEKNACLAKKQEQMQSPLLLSGIGNPLLRSHPPPAFGNQGADVAHDILGNRPHLRSVTGIPGETQGLADGDGIRAAQVPGDEVRFALETGWDAFAVLFAQVDAEWYDRSR